MCNFLNCFCQSQSPPVLGIAADVVAVVDRLEEITIDATAAILFAVVLTTMVIFFHVNDRWRERACAAVSTDNALADVLRVRTVDQRLDKTFVFRRYMITPINGRIKLATLLLAPL